MHRRLPRGLVRAAAPALALSLGACANMADMSPRMDFTTFEWNPYSKASTGVLAPPLRAAPATAADYINADGSCASAVAAEEGAEPVRAAVGLQMTECAVVRTLGAPQKIDIGANEQGERSVRLLYSGGERPGLYYFTAGRLTQIERVAEPAPPPKPQRQPAKPRRSVT